ncbi:HMCN1 [Bugula neritina]|uniref:HMCN1 n=1 Tax=Bugula neritina TaxID=10212 RepID=A0A7J7JKR1_BUGNE|nr:HMCN1 [Bugula neritina]
MHHGVLTTPQPTAPPRHHSYVERGWSAWSSWSSCSRACGGGEQRIYRTCSSRTVYGYGHDVDSCRGGRTTRKRRCNTHCCPVNGNWGQWTHWSNSHGSHHGYRQQSRTRYCNHPAPSCGGRSCYGSGHQTRAAYSPPPTLAPKSWGY